MEEFKIVESPKGTYSCELDISVDEWVKILSDSTITKQSYKDALLDFYNEPNHSSTCAALAMKHYGNTNDSQKYNACVSNFGEAVVKRLNRFQIINTNGTKSYWPVAMNPGKALSDGHFEWTLRDEVAKAIEVLGWNKRFTWIPFFTELADKLLTYKNDRSELVSIAYETGNAKYITDVNGGRVSDIDPFTFFGIFNRGLSDDSRTKLAAFFKSKFSLESEIPSDFAGIPVVMNQKGTFFNRAELDTTVPLLWELFEAALNKDNVKLASVFDKAHKQRGIKWNITMGLYWIRPYDYIGLDSTNRAYLDKIGVNVFDEKMLTGENYLKLLEEVKQKIDNHDIKESNIPEISYNAWIATPQRNYWLVGYTFSDKGSQLDRFIKDGIWEGRFSKDASSDKTMLKLAKSFKQGDALILKATSTKGSEHNKSFIRIKAVGVITSAIETQEENGEVHCACNVEYRHVGDKDFDGSIYGSYRKTIHKADNGKIDEVIRYVDSILGDIDVSEIKPNEISGGDDLSYIKYKKYIDLLKANYNLVLTGAPGTGKTFMAKEIAKAMGCSKDEMKFVQFHPSYDYTDFVEGLRPVENGTGQIGFERKDGVFKEFCNKALQNIIDSQKSASERGKELSWRERLEMFVNDAIEKETPYKLVSGAAFRITEYYNNAIIVNNEQNAVVQNVQINVSEIIDLLAKDIPLKKVYDIRKHFDRKYNTQQDSYTFVIVKEVRKMKNVGTEASADVVKKKPYVFIIDEINRGEVSKIFGELFYAIDPGYRGERDITVDTQYQNLIKESEPFHDGFFVPDNVYILCTMNDIDRSVESMDFAMRRRFTWLEVSPEETQSMLDGLGTELSEKAKACMNRINKSITDTDGLGAAYQLGASYFLKLKKNGGNFDDLWKMNIEPLLREYLRGSRDVEKKLAAFQDAFTGKENSSEEDSSGLVEE